MKIHSNFVTLLGDFEQNLKQEHIDRAESMALREGKPFINPTFYVPIFKLGLRRLEYINSQRFLESCDLTVQAYQNGSPESQLNELVQSYGFKIEALRKVQSRGLEPEGHNLVRVNGALINAAENSFKDRNHMLEETIRTCSRRFNPTKRGFLCKGYAEGLYSDTLPLIQVASEPIMQTGEYILGLIKNMGGPSIEITIPENN